MPVDMPSECLNSASISDRLKSIGNDALHVLLRCCSGSWFATDGYLRRVQGPKKGWFAYASGTERMWEEG
jgi:hypothetical protein